MNRNLSQGALASACVLLVSMTARATTVRQDGKTWRIENGRLLVTLLPETGRISVLDKWAKYEWRQPGSVSERACSFTQCRSVSEGVTFRTELPTWGGPKLPLDVTVNVPDRSADLQITASVQTPNAPIKAFPFLEPLMPGDWPGAYLAVADYSNGHLYPLDMQPFPARWHSGDRLNMPWVGVGDPESGRGYMLLLETSDDAVIRCESYALGSRQVSAPQVVWQPSKGAFVYPRKVRYRFFDRGGYVAMAKSYREVAKAQGLIVTLAEKLRKNPNLCRLFGAPDVWGDASLKFAREAKAAGVDKMLIHGRSSPEEMNSVRDLGYLTSEYDNYTDVLPIEPGKGVDSGHDRIPDNVVLQQDGKRMTAWLTFDKKTQYMKRCPAKWLDAARIVVPRALSERPFLGRFIDVTTAEGLYECFDPAHPLSKADKRKCGGDLLGYVRSQGLVVGGEHGIWWGVPHMDYIEGMMSGGGSYPWPAGHLIHPKSKDQEFTSPWGGKLGPWRDYEAYGVGHVTRVPLWELVFHDCVVSTWYWGDASDWLLEAAPEVTEKKDAFNVLYGTIPLLWANRDGSWQKSRELFLRTYRSTCKLHEAVAGMELLDHRFLTADRAVQQTRFAGGFTVIVNFGDQAYTARLNGRQYRLPRNGWVARGPGFEQFRAEQGGRVTLFIRTPSYTYGPAAELASSK